MFKIKRFSLPPFCNQKKRFLEEFETTSAFFPQYYSKLYCWNSGQGLLLFLIQKGLIGYKNIPQSVELGSKTSEFLSSLTSAELFKTPLVSMSLRNALANSVPAKQWVGLADLRALILLERSCIYWADFSDQSVKTLDIKVLSCELHLALLLLS